MWTIQANSPNTEVVGSKSIMILHFPTFLYVWKHNAVGHVSKYIAFSEGLLDWR
jgi:hypothetical protein